ncbi:DUF1824 family protein [Trichocoleus desertorum AS-A10]|uniref:DUF1824 family protein n=1 Tax=Trichocoleus desertorum TaxID=1481672 RepID=UPI003297A860
MQPLPELTVEAAHKILQAFTCIEQGATESLPSNALVRQALLFVTNLCDYQMVGICADNLTQGLAALKSYLPALGYNADEVTVDSIEGPTYIKFNSKTGLCYASPYPGSHRGVLVSCQSALSNGINETYGHLPLDLFLEAS